MEKRCHQLLGLAPGANRAEIRAAFHHLARQCHPDTAATDAADPARFQRLLAAYRHLCAQHNRSSNGAGRFAFFVRWRCSGTRLWRSVGRCLLSFVQPRHRPLTTVGLPTVDSAGTTEVRTASRHGLSTTFAQVLAARQQAEDLEYVVCADGVIRKKGAEVAEPASRRASAHIARLFGLLHGWWGVLLMMAVNGWGLFRE